MCHVFGNFNKPKNPSVPPNVITKTDKRFVSSIYVRVELIDSLNFMITSFGRIVETLTEKNLIQHKKQKVFRRIGNNWPWKKSLPY